MKIGLVELPYVQLLDPDGINRTPSLDNGVALISKQIILAQLQAIGYDAQLVDLRNGDYTEEYGEVVWKGMRLKKMLAGQNPYEIHPESYDAWGVTVNFTQQRAVACIIIKHLASRGKPVVVGGSDPIAEPHHYLEAGAAAVITDKSGGANLAVFDHVLGRPPREELTGVFLADGSQYASRRPPLNPETWSLPSPEVVKQCLGRGYYYELDGFQEFTPQGSVFSDLGCDRKCDFCQTPTYRVGYRAMSPQRTLEWCATQKEGGARSVQFGSDQFLGRVLWPEGRAEVFEITKGLREMELPVMWYNGLELKKATLGHGFPNSDLTPDVELIETLWGWDGKVGCVDAFIPAERPFVGRESYAKLLPWQQHREMLRAIVRAGVPAISYAVIIGFEDDSHESLLYLEDAVLTLFDELKTINPSLFLSLRANAIAPLPGTRQTQTLRQAGLLRFEDPEIMGTPLMPSADSNHLSYEEISDWQLRLLEIEGSYKHYYRESLHARNVAKSGN